MLRALLLACAFPLVAAAQPALTPDKSAVKATGAMSQRALVQRPGSAKGAQTWTLETKTHRGYASVMALSPDGKLLATGGLDGTVRLWDADTGEFARALVGHDYYVYGLAFSPSGQYLASGGSFDSTVRVWEVKTGQPVRVLRGHPAYVGPVGWSPDGKTLTAAGGQSGVLTSWDVTTGKLKQKGELGKPITGLTVHPTGSEVALAVTGQAVATWSPETGKVGRQYGDAASDFTAVAFSPDGKVLAAGTTKDTRLFDAESGAELRKLASSAVNLAWTPDGKRVATTAAAGATIWNATTGDAATKVMGAPSHVAFTPTGERLVGVWAVGAAMWVAADGKSVWNEAIGGSAAAVWSAGRPLVTGVGTNALTLWDATTAAKLRTLEGHTASVSAFAWSPDGKVLATASADKTVRLWDAATGLSRRTFGEHAAEVLAVEFSPDGKQVLSGAADGPPLVWDATTGKVAHALAAHRGGTAAVAWSQNGKFFATGGADAAVRLYAGGKLTKELSDSGAVGAVALSPDGKLVASAPRANVPRLLSPTGGLVMEFPAGSPQHATDFATSPSGSVLAVARANHTVQLLDWKAGKVTATAQCLAPPTYVAWATGGSALAAACADRVTRFFDPAGRVQGGYVLADDYLVVYSADGHYRSGGDAADVVYVAQTGAGQETHAAAAFAAKFGWKNNPALAKPTGR